MQTYVHALIVGIALIAAIGAQNAFIIREGLRGGFVYSAAFVSATCDALLIAVGIVLVAEISEIFVWFKSVMIGAAALFLLFYSYTTFSNAFARNPVGWAEAEAAQANTERLTRKHTVKVALAFSLFNPHVYLDTVLVLGGIGSSKLGFDKFLFWMGGATASYAWFFGTGFLAHKLAPLFKSERAGRTIDIAIGSITFALAVGLLYELWQSGSSL